jgi:hypothetical protein
MTTRRNFILATVPAIALAALASRSASAQAARLDEADRAAVALGYKHDATKADKATENIAETRNHVQVGTKRIRP